MLIATLIVTTIALVRRRFARKTGEDMPTAGPLPGRNMLGAGRRLGMKLGPGRRPGEDTPTARRRPLRKSGSILRRPAPVLATAATLAVLGAGGGVLMQC
ncbi:hypothetical protein ACWDYH_04340 [Nocardia goodfellowii]